MDKKVKLRNPNKFDVGIALENPHREQNIKPGSFAIVSEDDVYFLNGNCTLLSRGILSVESDNIEEVKQNLGFADVEPVVVNQEEITALLQGNFMKMKSGLEKYTEKFAIAAIYQIAQKNVESLTGGKLKFLSEFCGKPISVE